MQISRLFRIAVPLLALASIAAAQKQPQVKSAKEGEAFNAILTTEDPDARMAAVENLLVKFADTELKPIALQIAAMSAQQKNDYEKMVLYSERALEVDAKNHVAMLILAGALAHRTREFDLDKEEKLGKAEKFANQAIALVKVATKPNPQLTDEQWELAKRDQIAQGYEALGLAAMARKKFDVAATNFKQAVDTAAELDQATLVRLASAYNQSGKPDEAIATLDKLNTVPNVHEQIKAAASAERANAAKLKTGGAKPAATPAGAGTTSPTGTTTAPAGSAAPPTAAPTK